jgi:hypothetical protein
MVIRKPKLARTIPEPTAMDFDTAAASLGEFEAFDPAVFVDQDPATQRVCDLILALALIYNDFRDVLVSRTLLAQVAVKERVVRTPRIALENGLENTLVRLQAGVVHELLELVGRSRSETSSALFQRLLHQLSTRGRSAWEAVAAASAGKNAGDPLARVLLLVRHKIAFHYDAE